MRYAIYSHKPATIPSKKPHSALPAPSARIRGAVPLRKSELTHLSAAKTVAISGLPVQCLLVIQCMCSILRWRWYEAKPVTPEWVVIVTTKVAE